MFFSSTEDKIPNVSDVLGLVHCHEADIFATATALRVKHFGTRIELCAIINARSGQCSMDCAFCAQSKHYKTHTPAFELLSQAEIIKRIQMLIDYPIGRIGLVTSGGALQDEHVENLAKTLEYVSASFPTRWQGRICASFGKLSTQALERLKMAGLTRYHHNLESSAAYYPRICTTQTWQERLDTVKRAQKARLTVCAGGIFGLGESWEDRISFALSLRENNIQHVPINFLHPHAHTPLAQQAPLKAAEALRIIAIFRHILPTATLRVCGGRPLVLGDRQADMFAAGANALMTGNYLTTQGKGIEEDCAMIQGQNLTIATD